MNGCQAGLCLIYVSVWLGRTIDEEIGVEYFVSPKGKQARKQEDQSISRSMVLQLPSFFILRRFLMRLIEHLVIPINDAIVAYPEHYVGQ